MGQLYFDYRHSLNVFHLKGVEEFAVQIRICDGRIVGCEGNKTKSPMNENLNGEISVINLHCQ